MNLPVVHKPPASGFLVAVLCANIAFLCSWVSCKAILARRCSGPSRMIPLLSCAYCTILSLPALAACRTGTRSDISPGVLLAACRDSLANLRLAPAMTSAVTEE